MQTLLPSLSSLARDVVVEAIVATLAREAEANRQRLAQVRQDLRLADETDRDAVSLGIAEAGGQIAIYKRVIADNEAFNHWLANQGRGEGPVDPGNIWVVEVAGQREVWLFYDPDDAGNGAPLHVSLNDRGIETQLGIQRVATISSCCALYEWLAAQDIRPGAHITFSVEGNDPLVFTLEEIL